MYKRDYTIIISADVNDNVYWQMLRKGEPAACNEEEEKLAEEMLGEVFHKLEVNAFWKQSKREESDKDKFCKDNCKGYQQTVRCYADGRCKAYIENEKILMKERIDNIRHRIDVEEYWQFAREEESKKSEHIPSIVKWAKS